MADLPTVARALAEAALAGPFTAAGVDERMGRVLDRRFDGLDRLARRLVRAYAVPPSDAGPLVELVRRSRALRAAHGEARLHVVRWLFRAPAMAAPPAWADAEGLPAIATEADLARWLDLSHGELGWFAGTAGRDRRAPAGPLRHYTTRWVRKPSGGYRLLEAPKSRLREIQRRILREILDRAAVHEAAHGFVRGRGVVGFAREHVGQAIVIATDLRDFFASVRASRVHAIFAALGYPRAVARALTGLCTSVVPASEWATAPPPRDGHEVRARAEAFARFRDAHLPQGAPTSPALANLAALRLDVRLAAAARAAGARYGRYADDLVFSGGDDLARARMRFFSMVARIVAEEGFALAARKTRFLGRGMRQRVAGVVVNEHPAIARRDVERLEATLHNVAAHGPASQNRDGHPDFRAHLEGRVAWVRAVQPARGARLRAMFERIRWE